LRRDGSGAIRLLERDCTEECGFDVLEQQETGLPKAAAEELGYGVLLARTNKARAMQVLGALGARPFTEDSVEDYRRYKLKELNPMRLLPIYIEEWQGAIMWILAALCMGPGLLALFGLWIPRIAAVALLPMCLFIRLAMREITVIHFRAKWQTVPLALYSGMVPAQILELTLEARRRLPESTFEVDQLVAREVEYDPFMVLVYDGERYPFAVWGEWDFAQARQA
jgi:hypothetical protein